MTRIFHRFGWLALCFTGCFLIGCATGLSKSSRRMPPPPTEEVRSRLGTIVVESAVSGSAAEFAKPYTKGQAAAAGALGVAGECIGSGEVVGVIFMPIGAGIGAAMGASKGLPKEEVEAAERILLAVFNEMDFQRAVRDQVVQLGRKETRHAFVTGARGGSAAVLQVNVRGAGLAGGPESGAPLAMFLRVHVRLLAPGDRALLYEHEWTHMSGAYTYQEWAAGGGRLFRKHLSVASSAVARSIIEEIFLSYR
jgi:hypothetical protein